MAESHARAERRHAAASGLVAVNGTLEDMGPELARIWVDVLRADASVLWLYNREFAELNLLGTAANGDVDLGRFEHAEKALRHCRSEAP